MGKQLHITLFENKAPSLKRIYLPQQIARNGGTLALKFVLSRFSENVSQQIYKINLII